MCRIFVLLIFNFLLNVSFAIFNTGPSSPDEAGPPEPVPDDRLFCLDQLPLNKYGETEEKKGYRDSFLPVKDWSYMNFTSLADLCSARGNPEANMGGIVWPQRLLCQHAAAFLNLANASIRSASPLDT